MAEAIRAARGSELRCRGWRQEALLRLLENVLEVGEAPDKLIVYAALGKAARNWDAYRGIVHALKRLEEDETLVIQSGKPIGVFKTHTAAPLVVMANCNLVGRWATSEQFYELEKKGLIAWGGLTAGAWQYIGSQGVIQGTYEILAQVGREHFGGDLRGRFFLTAGLGGMGGSQPLAGLMHGMVTLAVEVDRERIERRVEIGYCQRMTDDLDEALAWCQEAQAAGEALSVGLVGNAADVFPELVRRNITPDVVTDQTAAHDLLYGYIPAGLTVAEANALRERDPQERERRALVSIVAEVQAMLTFRERGAVVFDNGNLIRVHAANAGLPEAMSIDIFTERYIRPLFCRGIGPFRWIALSGEESDIAKIDAAVLERFPDNPIATNWVRLASQYIPFQGLPSRIGWLGHGERTQLALAVNDMVRNGELAGPVAFTRDHLDAGGMAHPYIGTERMRDGSDAVADWPLLNAMLNGSAGADLVAIHSGGGGYAGYMTSAGVTITADGSDDAADRLRKVLDADTGLGVLRYADAGYDIARQEAAEAGLGLKA